MSSALLELAGLNISLPGADGPIPVVRGVDLSVRPGEIVGIAGESGSGKSLTARALLGLLPDGSTVGGSARFADRELVGLPARQWRQVRGVGISMVFQDSTAALHPMLSIGVQLTEHMRASLGLSRRAARLRAVELLEQVRIPQPERALRGYPHQFSGGMRQRIAIAGALACKPRLLIADEPTTALDVTVQAGILALLHQLCADSELSVLFITHDLGVLGALAARSYIFYAGRVMEAGPTAEVLTEPAHPYTAALLGARPHGLESGRTLTAIAGSPASAADAPSGCPFAPRCRHAEDRCSSAVPPTEIIAPGRSLACVVRPSLTEAAR